MGNMKKAFSGIAGALTGVLMIYGLLYVKEKAKEKQIGGRLVKVDYQFSKNFDVE